MISFEIMTSASDLSSTLAVITIFVFVPLLGSILSIVLSNRAVRKRDELLKSKLGNDIKISRSFPINQDVEEIVQGGLSQTIQDFREIIVGKDWIYVQPTTKRFLNVTKVEERGFVTHSMFVRQLNEFTPFIVIRNANNKSLLSRKLQTKIKNKEIVWCEAAFDKDQNIYNEPNSHIDTLSILSPEVLEVLKDSPANADIILKKNQLYYILQGNRSAETTVPELLAHSNNVVRELEENLSRWAKSKTNKNKIEKIASTELAVTLREQHERKLCDSDSSNI